jgi:hypothetical protein
LPAFFVLLEVVFTFSRVILWFDKKLAFDEVLSVVSFNHQRENLGGNDV